MYDISLATGYKGGLSTPDSTAVNDSFLQTWFESNIYTSLPDINSSTGLNPNDLSGTFNYKSYADAETAKTAVLSATTINWIESNSESVNYTWSSGQLKIDMLFADQSAYDTYLAGIKSDAKRSYNFVGPAIGHSNS